MFLIDKLQEYMELVNKMDYSGKPDYDKIRELFLAGLKQYGATDDGKTIRLPTAKALKVYMYIQLNSCNPNSYNSNNHVIRTNFSAL